MKCYVYLPECWINGKDIRFFAEESNGLTLQVPVASMKQQDHRSGFFAPALCPRPVVQLKSVYGIADGQHSYKSKPPRENHKNLT